MADGPEGSIIRRKAGNLRGSISSSVMSAGRAWYLTMPRVADDVLGLELSVTSFQEGTADPETLLEDVETSALLLSLSSQEGREGLAILDASLLTALIEIQMVGEVTKSPPPDRRPTTTDAAICSRILQAWASAFDEATAFMTKQPPWAHVRPNGSFPDARSAAMSLEPGELKVAQLTLDLGAGSRQGALTIAMPSNDVTVGHPTRQSNHATDLGAELRPVLLDSAARLEVVLCRPKLPFERVDSLSPGERLRVPIEALSSVSLETEDGQIVTQARLGQVEGMRAIRLPDLQLAEMAQPFAVAASPSKQVAISSTSEELVASSPDPEAYALGLSDPLDDAVVMGEREKGDADPI